MIILSNGSGDTPDNTRSGGKPMSTMEVLTLGILLVNVIELVFSITKKDK